MEGRFSWQIGDKLFCVNLLGDLLDQLLMIKGYTLEDKALTSQQNSGNIYSLS